MEIISDVKRLESDPEVVRRCQQNGIIWKFQLPAATHFGEAHESLVQSVTVMFNVLRICLANVDEELSLLSRCKIEVAYQGTEFSDRGPSHCLRFQRSTRSMEDRDDLRSLSWEGRQRLFPRN